MHPIRLKTDGKSLAILTIEQQPVTGHSLLYSHTGTCMLISKYVHVREGRHMHINTHTPHVSVVYVYLVLIAEGEPPENTHYVIIKDQQCIDNNDK